MSSNSKIAFGGGCHWCTEAVFQSIKGVFKVEQGYMASELPYDSLSEAVIIYYDREQISLKVLIEIHLYTHESTSNHSMRDNYRSAVYYFNEEDFAFAKAYISKFQQDFNRPLITQVLPFKIFKASRESIRDYYKKNPEKPFCKRYIAPKLKLILEKFQNHYNPSFAS
ncbi:peptide methionine sulfoxide reductase [Dokdonia sinensis]|uniref:peptide-methionine (S)-S-oxide reductase n=1 Tax=Dokdonia sinensis TaxID=2479847 RepID=A0A3M0G3P4_9FLAO|nr:peptide-methionine (S)-S-oxide reductase [Dokdonia sinensis]RMB59435.1 peptide methionine sulfoxide reductase [Dokdonia sinensis]